MRITQHVHTNQFWCPEVAASVVGETTKEELERGFGRKESHEHAGCMFFCVIFCTQCSPALGGHTDFRFRFKVSNPLYAFGFWRVASACILTHAKHRNRSHRGCIKVAHVPGPRFQKCSACRKRAFRTKDVETHMRNPRFRFRYRG